MKTLRMLLATAACLATMVAPAATAQAAPSWLDGNIAQEIVNSNCLTSSPEFEIGAYVGEYVDETIPSPVVGEVFDVHIVVATLGNECAGTAPKIEIALPPGVTPAITDQVGIRCYLGPIGNMGQVGEECPDQLGIGTTNQPFVGPWYGVNPDGNFPAWPLPQGHAVEIQVPVKSDRILSGIGDTSGCVCVLGSVETINGTSQPDFNFEWQNGSPQSGPFLSMFVFEADQAGYSFPKKFKAKKAAKKGVPVKIEATAGAVEHQIVIADKKGKKVGSAGFSATEPGTEKVKVKLTKKGAKLAKKKKLKKATITASSTGEGAKDVTVTKPIKLK